MKNDLIDSFEQPRPIYGSYIAKILNSETLAILMKKFFDDTSINKLLYCFSELLSDVLNQTHLRNHMKDNDRLSRIAMIKEIITALNNIHKFYGSKISKETKTVIYQQTAD